MGKLTSFFRVRNELDHVEDSLDNRSLEFVSSLVAKYTGKEGEHDGLLGGEFEAECSDSVDDDDLELVRDLAHELGDLLHEAVNGSFITGLEEGRDGESCDTSVVVVDEFLHVEVASLNGVGVSLSKFGESTDGGKLKSRFGGREEELQDWRKSC